MAYVKLDCGILNSTLWVEKPCRDIFLTALLLARPKEFSEPVRQLEVSGTGETGFVAPPGWYGMVDAAGPGIVSRAGLEMELGLTALRRLGEPDPESRTPDFEGRRMIRISGGYLILNYDAYREKDHTAADRVRRFRDKQRAARNAVALQSNAVQTPSVTEAVSSKQEVLVKDIVGLKPDAVAILEFLNEKAGRAYQPTDANLGLIKARLKEGYTVAQCKQVIAKKCREWGGDDKMAPYLRPATLFNCTKFNNYAGELVNG